MIPTITIRASSTILNADRFLPVKEFVASGETADISIVETCKLTLNRIGVAILFKRSGITLFVEDETKLRKGKYNWLDHLVNYLVYRSLVAYREYCNWFADDEASFGTCEEAGRVLLFNLERPSPEGIKKVGDRLICSDPAPVEIERAEFDDFHKLIDRTLAVALAYFLIGCDNPRYFLIEYYKCLEVIRREMGGETAMFKALTPHGFTKKMFKTLTKNANDVTMPISFGRHATEKDTGVFDIDVRSLLQPKTYQNEMFLESMRICRAAIDAYVVHLRA